MRDPTNVPEFYCEHIKVVRYKGDPWTKSVNLLLGDQRLLLHTKLLFHFDRKVDVS